MTQSNPRVSHGCPKIPELSKRMGLHGDMPKVGLTYKHGPFSRVLTIPIFGHTCECYKHFATTGSARNYHMLPKMVKTRMLDGAEYSREQDEV